MAIAPSLQGLFLYQHKIREVVFFEEKHGEGNSGPHIL
jgi:hypothetical protein